jgi:hypothetical protein
MIPPPHVTEPLYFGCRDEIRSTRRHVETADAYLFNARAMILQASAPTDKRCS